MASPRLRAHLRSTRRSRFFQSGADECMSFQGRKSCVSRRSSCVACQHQRGKIDRPAMHILDPKFVTECTRPDERVFSACLLARGFADSKMQADYFAAMFVGSEGMLR